MTRARLGVGTAASPRAFAVLIYYAVINLAALRVPTAGPLFPRWVSAAGFVSCVSLAFFAEPLYWCVGVGVLAVGLVLHAVARRMQKRAGG